MQSNIHLNKNESREDGAETMLEIIMTKWPQNGEKHLFTDSRSPKNLYNK